MRVTLRVCFAAAGFTLLAATAADPASPAVAGLCGRPATVTPGVGVGSLTLGTQLDDAFTAFGPASRLLVWPDARALVEARKKPRSASDLKNARAGWAAAIYDSGPNTGVNVIAHTGVVVRIDLSNGPRADLANCATADGIHPGVPASTVSSLWGPPDHRLRIANITSWLFDRGVVVVLMRDPNQGGDAVYDLGIFRRGEFCEVSLVDGAKYTPPAC